MKKLLIVLTGSMLLLSACQKEKSLEDPNATPGTGSGTGNNNNGTRLTHIGSRIGADTITTSFRYTTGGRLNAIEYSGSVDGQDAGAQIRIFRNSADIITSYVTKAELFTAIGIDSLVTNFLYDAATSRYRYGVTRYTFMGDQSADSVVFNYDGAGKLISAISFHDEGAGFEQDTKDEITYSGNNIASVKTYTFDGSVFVPEQTTTYDLYDNKSNPLFFPQDAPALGMTTFYSANNVVKRTITDHTSGESASGTFTYSYNTNNRPTKAVSSHGTASSTSNYFYQ